MAGGKFLAQVKGFRQEVMGPGGLAEQAVRQIVLDMFSGVILMSPVGNPEIWAVNQGKIPGGPGWVSHPGAGRFRGNWQPAIGNMPTGTVELLDPDGTIVIAKVQGEVSGLKIGDTIFMVNNLPYGPALETGHSKQAPAGMVGLTVQRFEPVVAAVARALAR